MNSMMKFFSMSVALVLPCVVGCAEVPGEGSDSSTPAASEGNGADASKPQLPSTSDGTLKASAKAGGYVVIPYLTGPVVAANNNLALGASTTLTATTQIDVGPTPYYIEIFDATTATRVAVCSAGTSCQATVSQSAATSHAYVAYVSNNSATMPPGSIQSTTDKTFVTWSSTGYTVSLPAQLYCYGPGEVHTVTATANVNVGPTIYYIEVFNATTGARLASCGTGTSCAATVACGTTKMENLVAFISNNATSFPPGNIQASSATMPEIASPIIN
jgi:hypothetical protein